ncbi:MAG: hypothetical protein AABX47_05935 [Nanoarchaeota archaeon]
MPKIKVVSSSEKRRGQLSVFIVVSVVLVFLIAFLYNRVVLTEKRVSEMTKTQQQWDVQAVQGMVQGCLDKVATDSVFYFGMVGGRTGYFPQSIVYDQYYTIPYYFWTGRSLMPSKREIENDILGTYVASRLKACTAGFTSVQGFVISEGDITSKVTIDKKSVDFKIDYPIEITKGDQKTVLREFSFRLPSRLYDLVEFSSEIVKREEQDDSIIHWDYMTEFTKRGYNVTAHAEQIHTIVYRVVDTNDDYRLYFEPYMFQFANRVVVQG